MYKKIPEIRVSTENTSENELLCSDNYHSDDATDCEVLESHRNTPLLHSDKQDEDLLTDLEGSNDEDDLSTVCTTNYPTGTLNRVFDIGMNCEEITNCKGPTKSQSIISLDKIKLNEFIKNENNTDLEDFSDNDIDLNQESFTDDISLDYLETGHIVSIKDKDMIQSSPIHTPEPGVEVKEKNILTIEGNKVDCFTDTEMLLTDNENKTKKKLTITNKTMKFSSASGSCTSDSDEDLEKNKETIRNNQKKFICYKTTTSTNSSTKKGSLLQLKQHQDINLTDVETIELDNARPKTSKKQQVKRQNIVQNKSVYTACGKTMVTYQKVKQCKYDTDKKWHQKSACSSKSCKYSKSDLIATTSADVKGRLTDIEAFESDEEITFDDVIKPQIQYSPETRYDIVLSSENTKGGVSLIMPIGESTYNQNRMSNSIIMRDSGGLTDIEEVSDFEEIIDKTTSVTPDLPFAENSIIQNVENLVDNSKLKINLDIQEPITDTEELDIQKPLLKSRLSKGGNQKGRNLNIKESTTDIEDLSDIETNNLLKIETVIQKSDTDIEVLSSDEVEDDAHVCSSITPDIKSVNIYTASKEGIGPFPIETKQKMNNAYHKIRVLSPNPILYQNTDEEIASMDDDDDDNEQANISYSTDEDNLEEHKSIVHIKHTRKFPLDGMETLHIKECDVQPDPLTDTEEILPIDENVHQLQHRKKFNNQDDSSVSFDQSSAGITCKWQSQRRFSNTRREEKIFSGEKISHHKPIDVTKIQKQEEELHEMAIGYSEPKPGSGKPTSTQKKK